MHILWTAINFRFTCLVYQLITLEATVISLYILLHLLIVSSYLLLFSQVLCADRLMFMNMMFHNTIKLKALSAKVA